MGDESYINWIYNKRNKMSTENSTAEDILNKHLNIFLVTNNTVRNVYGAMEEFAAHQVEQQTKQLREERDSAISLLKSIRVIFDRTDQHAVSDMMHFMYNDVDYFLNQLNQQNEG